MPLVENEDGYDSAVDEMKQATVLALGHRFASLAIESQVLSDVATIIDGNTLTADQLGKTLEDTDAVLLGTRARLDAAQIISMQRCRVIARYGVGIDNVDLEQATRRGIMITNVPDYCADEVSDHAVTMLLAASRRLVQAQSRFRAGEWGTAVMRGVGRLAEQAVGLVGFGRIGQLAFSKVRPFVRRVMAFDPIIPAATIVQVGAEPVDLQCLFMHSDFISLHCPLTGETRHMVNRDLLAQIKPNAWLVNTSRGELVDQAALIEALAEQRLGGAALDVFETEPPSQDSPLFKLENVILTPHVAWYSERAIEDLQRLAAVQVRSVLVGELPTRLCNPRVIGTRLSNKGEN